jgi:hypothetical protein
MKNVEPGPNFKTDAKDYTLLSFTDPLNTVIFGGEVLITQIWKTQFRVYSAGEKALIDKCEDENPSIPHSNLKKMFYGHPKHNGDSPFCKSVEDHLKDHVANRKLSHQNGNPVDDSSIEKVNEYISKLSTEKRVSSRDLEWADNWKNKKLIGDLPAKVVLAQTVQKAKLFGASTDFKDWFAVIMLH